MAATYDPTLATDRDHVRLLVGDTDTAAAKLSDEEIDALLTAESMSSPAVRYFAAARALGVLLTRWSSAGEGVVEKAVGDLRIRYGSDSTAGQAVEARMADLRARGARLLSPAPWAFKVL